MDFQELLIRHIARALDNQMTLSELLGSSNYTWGFNMDTGKLTLNQKLSYSTQLIGTEADASATWLWAWANVESGIPDNLLKAVTALKNYGEQQQIDVFSQEEVELNDQHNGHHFSMIASGLAKANAYFRADYDGGALYLLIKDETFPKSNVHPVQRIAMTFPKLIMSTAISNHRRAFAYYLNSYGLEVKQDKDAIIGQHADGKSVRATFDELNRLAQVSTTLGGKS